MNEPIENVPNESSLRCSLSVRFGTSLRHEKGMK